MPPRSSLISVVGNELHWSKSGGPGAARFFICYAAAAVVGLVWLELKRGSQPKFKVCIYYFSLTPIGAQWAMRGDVCLCIWYFGFKKAPFKGVFKWDFKADSKGEFKKDFTKDSRGNCKGNFYKNFKGEFTRHLKGVFKQHYKSIHQEEFVGACYYFWFI